MKRVIEKKSVAKLNLFLAVLGKRSDIYHDILSLVARVRFGDNLRMELVPGGEDKIECDVCGVPLGEENLIMKAIGEVRKRVKFREGVRVILDKKIPMGAGLGGGSSNGVATLVGLNELLGKVLREEELRTIAKSMGSDCLFFLEEGVKVIRGRGDEVERVGIGIEERISGKRIIIFKPQYSIATAWAYGEMAKRPELYIKQRDAEVALDVGLGRLLKGEGLEGLLYNNFEYVIFEKYPELKKLMKELYEEFHVKGLLSGSGSACFVLMNLESDSEGIKRKIKEVLGEEIFMIETEME
ncbi:MAG: 4-(cytidine 5'-diphospho)-2-C-methyl-D-erythritol kinase [Verrucomicrobia bacterium]|nr:MAG: 4-(cytidine 5'-diphospho)-2-C-methyl-D-erythritol kinase [Verrucomicrobiota bacterium]